MNSKLKFLLLITALILLPNNSTKAEEPKTSNQSIFFLFNHVHFESENIRPIKYAESLLTQLGPDAKKSLQKTGHISIPVTLIKNDVTPKLGQKLWWCSYQIFPPQQKKCTVSEFQIRNDAFAGNQLYFQTEYYSEKMNDWGIYLLLPEGEKPEYLQNNSLTLNEIKKIISKTPETYEQIIEKRIINKKNKPIFSKEIQTNKLNKDDLNNFKLDYSRKIKCQTDASELKIISFSKNLEGREGIETITIVDDGNNILVRNNSGMLKTVFKIESYYYLVMGEASGGVYFENVYKLNGTNFEDVYFDDTETD